MSDSQPSTIAVLGTLTEFHQQPLPYDLTALVKLVQEINPDLLCLDMTMEQWQRQEFSNLPQEYVEALLPLAAQTDIVVAPVGGHQPTPRTTAVGWRGQAIHTLRDWLAWLQRSKPGPTAMNQGWRHHLGNILYGLTRRLAGRELEHAYHQRIAQLTQGVLGIVENNPGSRILVVTNIQYCHHIRPRLRQYPNILEKAVADL